MEVPIYYDPMIAKLITYGATRAEAIQKMIAAINDYRIEGIETTLPFGRFVCQHPAFRSGDFSTNFVARYFTPEAVADQDRQEQRVAALLAAYVFNRAAQQLTVPTTSPEWRSRR